MKWRSPLKSGREKDFLSLQVFIETLTKLIVVVHVHPQVIRFSLANIVNTLYFCYFSTSYNRCLVGNIKVHASMLVDEGVVTLQHTRGIMLFMMLFLLYYVMHLLRHFTLQLRPIHTPLLMMHKFGR